MSYLKKKEEERDQIVKDDLVTPSPPLIPWPHGLPEGAGTPSTDLPVRGYLDLYTPRY